MALDRLAKPLHGRTDADDAQIVAHRIVVVLSQKCYGTLPPLLGFTEAASGARAPVSPR